MKLRITLLMLLALSSSAVPAHADLKNFLESLNIQAKADMTGYSVKLGAQFGVPLPEVQAMIRTVAAPADAFMCLQLSRMTHQRMETVQQAYQRNRGRGWGVIARDLGIKPGSADFHALKRGDFNFSGEPGGETLSHGPGKGRGKGHGR